MAMGSSAMDLVTLRPEIDFQGPINHLLGR